MVAAVTLRAPVPLAGQGRRGRPNRAANDCLATASLREGRIRRGRRAEWLEAYERVYSAVTFNVILPFAIAGFPPTPVREMTTVARTNVESVNRLRMSASDGVRIEDAINEDGVCEIGGLPLPLKN